MNDDRKLESEERSWLDRLTHFISGEPQNKSDLEGVLSLAEEHEIIDGDARKIMEGALLVTDMQVRDIMIPRAQMIVIDSDQPLQEALPKIVQSGHSRYPVIGDGIDDVIGILLAKDLLPLIQNDGNVPASQSSCGLLLPSLKASGSTCYCVSSGKTVTTWRSSLTSTVASQA